MEGNEFKIMLRHELRAWFYHFCFNCPGNIGTALRRWLLNRKCKSVGKNIEVSPGCVFEGLENMEFGDNVSIGPRCYFTSTQGSLRIGSNVAFNANVFLGADYGKIHIGDFVIVAMNVVVRAADHNFDQSPSVPIRKQGHRGFEIKIGNDVWIAANVSIVNRAKIGDHCVVGAGAVVIDELPPCSVSVGIPAKAIKRLAPGASIST